MKARFIIAVAASLLLPNMSQASEIKLLASVAMKEAYLELIPQFEQATGHKISVAWSSTPDVQKRIAAGEAADLIILGDSETEKLIKQGKLVASSRVNFAKSGIGADRIEQRSLDLGQCFERNRVAAALQERLDKCQR